MGVRYLTTFVERYCGRWELGRRVRGALVVDGNCVLHELHNAEWSNGGQYREFSNSVRRFYRRLLQSGITPIVVFDGVDESQKVDTLLKRKQDWVDIIHKRITDNVTREQICRGRILPPLTSEVYRMTLHGLDIQFCVADAEADVVAARLANHYRCPVLSSDSDFYVFHLVGGFIHFEKHFYWESHVVTADVYHRDDFTTQLCLKEPALFCLIPAIVGNDFIPPSHPYFINQMLGSITLAGPQIRNICQHLSLFDSVEDFISRSFGGRKLESQCREAVQWYDVCNSVSCEEVVESTDLRQYNGGTFPQWLTRLFHRGHLPSFPLDAAVSRHIILRVTAENFHKESTVLAGRAIRQQMYAMLDTREVVEVFRQGLTLAKVKVTSRELGREFRGVTVATLQSLTPRERQDLFYTILECDKPTIDLQLTGPYQEWKFVAATASYWAKTTCPPDHLVQSLLLCFMLCSRLSDHRFHQLRPSIRVPEEFRRSQRWLDTLHWFTQWQVVHHTAWTLNALLMEPMGVFSPAFLYDGQLAMHLAATTSSDDISRWMVQVDVSLYRHLEEIVFSARLLTPPRCEIEHTLPPSPVSDIASDPGDNESVIVEGYSESEEDTTDVCPGEEIESDPPVTEPLAGANTTTVQPQVERERAEEEKERVEERVTQQKTNSPMGGVTSNTEEASSKSKSTVMRQLASPPTRTSTTNDGQTSATTETNSTSAVKSTANSTSAANSTTTAANSTTTPANSTTTPANSTTTAANSTTTPANSTTTAATFTTTPANSTTSAANFTTTAANSTTTPANSTTAAANFTTTTANSTTAAANSTTTAANSTTTAANSTTNAANSTTTPANSTTAANSTTTAANSTTTAANFTTTTANSTSAANSTVTAVKRKKKWPKRKKTQLAKGGKEGGHAGESSTTNKTSECEGHTQDHPLVPCAPPTGVQTTSSLDKTAQAAVDIKQTVDQKTATPAVSGKKKQVTVPSKSQEMKKASITKKVSPKKPSSPAVQGAGSQSRSSALATNQTRAQDTQLQKLPIQGPTKSYEITGANSTKTSPPHSGSASVGPNPESQRRRRQRRRGKSTTVPRTETENQARAHDRVKSAVVAIPPSSPVQTPRGVPQSPPTTTGAVPNKGGGSSSLTQRPKQSKDTTQTVNSPPLQSPHPLPTAVRTVEKREVFMPGKAQTGNSSTHTSEDRSRQTSAVRSQASGGQCQEESATAAKRRNRNRRRKAAQKAQSGAPVADDTLVAQSVQ